MLLVAHRTTPPARQPSGVGGSSFSSSTRHAFSTMPGTSDVSDTYRSLSSSSSAPSLCKILASGPARPERIIYSPGLSPLIGTTMRELLRERSLLCCFAKPASKTTSLSRLRTAVAALKLSMRTPAATGAAFGTRCPPTRSSSPELRKCV